MLLRELHERRVVDEAGDGWVFVSPVYPGYPIDATSLAKAYQRIWPQYPITAHGFRATYRTISHAIWASIRLYWSCFTACRACWALFTRAPNCYHGAARLRSNGQIIWMACARMQPSQGRLKNALGSVRKVMS